jgi:hypothetical protein
MNTPKLNRPYHFFLLPAILNITNYFLFLGKLVPDIQLSLTKTNSAHNIASPLDTF